MSDTTGSGAEHSTEPTPSDPARPAFMGPEAPVDEGARGTAPHGGVDADTDGFVTPADLAEDGAGRGRAWIPISIVGALILGIGLGVGGTLLFTGGDDADPDPQQAQAAAGPTDGTGTATEITLPQVGSDDPDAFGTVQITGAALPRLAGETDFAVGSVAPESSPRVERLRLRGQPSCHHQ